MSFISILLFIPAYHASFYDFERKQQHEAQHDDPQDGGKHRIIRIHALQTQNIVSQTAQCAYPFRHNRADDGIGRRDFERRKKVGKRARKFEKPKDFQFSRPHRTHQIDHIGIGTAVAVGQPDGDGEKGRQCDQEDFGLNVIPEPQRNQRRNDDGRDGLRDDEKGFESEIEHLACVHQYGKRKPDRNPCRKPCNGFEKGDARVVHNHIALREEGAEGITRGWQNQCGNRSGQTDQLPDDKEQPDKRRGYDKLIGDAS